MKIKIVVELEMKTDIDVPVQRALAYVDGALTRDATSQQPGVVTWTVYFLKRGSYRP